MKNLYNYLLSMLGMIASMGLCCAAASESGRGEVFFNNTTYDVVQLLIIDKNGMGYPYSIASKATVAVLQDLILTADRMQLVAVYSGYQQGKGSTELSEYGAQAKLLARKAVASASKATKSAIGTAAGWVWGQMPEYGVTSGVQKAAQTVGGYMPGYTSLPRGVQEYAEAGSEKLQRGMSYVTAPLGSSEWDMLNKLELLKKHIMDMNVLESLNVQVVVGSDNRLTLQWQEPTQWEILEQAPQAVPGPVAPGQVRPFEIKGGEIVEEEPPV